MPELRAYSCGHTRHNQARLIRGGANTTRRYPAGVFVYDDGRHRVLFDTGYAPPPWRTGLPGWLYRRALPPVVAAEEVVTSHVDPDTVTHVVLSHLHPDHIGGVQYFPRAKFVLSAGIAGTLRSSRLREGVLRGLIPQWFADADHLVIDEFGAGPHGLRTVDLFGDGSYLIADLPGHSRGHIGALISDTVLLAADASWGADLLGQEDRIRVIPRMVAHDYPAVVRTARTLLDAQERGVRLIFSHDPRPQGEVLR